MNKGMCLWLQNWIRVSGITAASALVSIAFKIRSAHWALHTFTLLGVMNFKMIFWCSLESKPSSHISIKIKILFQIPVKLREVMIVEKQRGGSRSCSVPDTHFSQISSHCFSRHHCRLGVVPSISQVKASRFGGVKFSTATWVRVCLKQSLLSPSHH